MLLKNVVKAIQAMVGQTLTQQKILSTFESQQKYCIFCDGINRFKGLYPFRSDEPNINLH